MTERCVKGTTLSVGSCGNKAMKIRLRRRSHAHKPRAKQVSASYDGKGLVQNSAWCLLSVKLIRKLLHMRLEITPPEGLIAIAILILAVGLFIAFTLWYLARHL